MIDWMFNIQPVFGYELSALWAIFEWVSDVSVTRHKCNRYAVESYLISNIFGFHG
jgi:hypothetical protein